MLSENRTEKVTICYLWAIAGLGLLIFAYSLAHLPLPQLGWHYVVWFGAVIVLGSFAVVDIKLLKTNISATELFTFLTILVFDGEAAIVLSTAEAFSTSFRFTKSPRVRAFNAATMACSTAATVWVLRHSIGPVTQIPLLKEPFKLVCALLIMSVVQYLVNSGLMTIANALRRRESLYKTWKDCYLWTSTTYLAGASSAIITAILFQQLGFYALLITLPLVGMVYFTYSTYTRHIEATAEQATQAKAHLEEMRLSEERFRSAFDHAPIGMALVAPDGQWLQVNRSLCEILGYEEKELLTKRFQDLLHPAEVMPTLAQVGLLIQGARQACQTENCYYHATGREVWVLSGISRTYDAQRKDISLVFQLQDITDRKAAEAQLRHGAFHDALTGLTNRALFTDHLNLALEQSKRAPHSLFAVLFIDLDRFKVINDSIGHAVGDQLLIEIARRLRNCMRPGDTVSRLGGDEFAILVENIYQSSDAVKVAEKIQKQLSYPATLSGQEVFTTASIGITLYDPRYQTPAEMLRDADTAMYQAKASGRALHAIFDTQMHARILRQLQLETDLRRAVERGEFFIVYQPIVKLETLQLTGFEALVRWRHPERGLVQPDEFIAFAEDTGLIVPIGRWVLAEACRQIRRWQHNNTMLGPFTVSVNVSGKQFALGDLIHDVSTLLQDTGAAPQQLKLEITESVVMDNLEAAHYTLSRLRATGVRLSIDDFGTGYSSLRYLHSLPLDTLKIDRSFVAQMNHSRENAEIVRTIITLAHTLGLGVIAEGVETQEQLEQLKSLGCNSGQGYLFSHPLTVAEIDGLAWRKQYLTPEHFSFAPRSLPVPDAWDNKLGSSRQAAGAVGRRQEQ